MQIRNRVLTYAPRFVAVATAATLALGLAPAPVSAAPATAGAESTARAAQAIRTDLNGQRFINRRTNSVFVVLDGRRSWIPDAPTYNSLFRSWGGIKDVIDIESIDLGPTLTSGAHLARAHGRLEVYLISNGVKRHVTSMAAMHKYHFDLNKVVLVPAATIDSIPTGLQIS